MSKNFNKYEKEVSKYDVIYHRYLGRLIELFPIHEGASAYFLADALYKNSYYNSDGSRIVIVVNNDFLDPYKINESEYKENTLLSSFNYFNNNLKEISDRLYSLCDNYKSLLIELDNDITNSYNLINETVNELLGLLGKMKDEPFALAQNKLNYDLLLKGLSDNYNSILRSVTLIKEYKEKYETLSKQLNVEKVIDYQLKEIETFKKNINKQLSKFSSFNRIIFKRPTLKNEQLDDNSHFLKMIQEYEDSFNKVSEDELSNIALKVLVSSQLVKI